jgi:DNA-binding CsgD family transcriptional regulator
MLRMDRGGLELLEREAEVRRLEALIADTSAGGASVLVIEGPSGIGKSALLEQAVRIAERAGMRVLTARGTEFERDFAWGVARQLLERPLLAAGRRESLLGGAARHAASALGLARPDEPAVDDPGFVATHGLYWLCVNLAAEQPLLIAVDDVHWADASSLRWLAYLARRLAGLPMLLALTARPAEPGSEHAVVSEIASEAGAEVMRPAVLTPAAVARLVRSRLSELAEEEFCAACHRTTGGNPFLVHELLAALAANRVEPTAAEAQRVAELGGEAISHSVLVRLKALPDGAARLAGALAVLGADAELRHTAALAGLDAEAAGDAADALAAVELIRVRRPLEFVHPIVAAAIYSNIPRAQRALMHRQAARLLADEGASPDHVAAQLVQSEPFSDPWAVEALRRAAANALERGAPGTAVAYLRRALLEPPSYDCRPIVLRELGSAELQAGDLTREATATQPCTVAHLEEAVELTAEPRERARITLELGEALWALQQHSPAISVFERGIAEAAETAPELATVLDARLAATALLDLQTAPLALRRLAALGELEGRSAPERALLGARAFAALLEGKPADVVAALATRPLGGKESLEEQTSPGALMHAAQALTCVDKLDDAERFYSQTIADARARGAVRPLTVALCWRSHLLFRRGALADAEADAREALDIASALGWKDDLPATRAFLADALAARGDLATALELLRPHLGAEEMPDYIGWNYLVYSRGCVRAALGDARQGLGDLLACGRRQARWQTSNPALIPWRSAAALVHAALGMRDEARTLVDDELTSARRFGAPRALGIALRATALVVGGDQGVGLLREAVGVLERSPAQLELARALTDLGAALRRQRQRAAAREPLRRALDLAHRGGAAPLAEQARIELLATGARPRRLVLTGLDALTASERRVAQMAADGRTNREIAEALFVTQRTIETHLSHVYRKLGITTRAELAQALAGEAPDHPIAHERKLVGSRSAS